MKKIYLTHRFPPIAKEMLLAHFLVEESKAPFLSMEHIVQNFDGVLSSVEAKFPSTVLQKATKLQAISNYAIGLDNIDLEAAKQKKIAVYNLPDIVTNSTADLTLALLLSFIRKIGPAERYVKENHWNDWQYDLFLGEELHGKTCGILGMGRIGKAVARRVLGFGVNVIYYNRSEVVLPPELSSCEKVSLDELFSRSNYLLLHVPLTEQTKGLINLEAFKKMKSKPLLINAARGAVVKTEDLIVALKEGMIRGAALDVTDPEPIPGRHPLCAFENCLIVPHIGSATKECRWEMAKKASQNLINHFS